MVLLKLKSAVTAITAASGFSKRVSLQSNSKATIKLEDLVNKDNTTPPHVHASNGDLDALQDSVKVFGLTLRERDRNGFTLLHYAARASQLLIMQFLIEKGIELDAADESGNTALHLSVMASHTDGIHLLLGSGACCDSLNNERTSPLHLAAKDLSGKSLGACLCHSVNIYVKGPRNCTILHALSETDNVEGFKVLNEYVESHKVDICYELLETSDDDGFTPLHLAARKNAYKVLELVVTYFKDKGRSVESLFDLINEENSTPLHVAVDRGNYEVVCVLLKYGAYPCILKEDMSPPLHLACSLGRLDIVKAMVEYAGVEILHQLDHYQRSPLHYSALSIRSISIISYFFEEGQSINVDQQDSKGKTPLHISISSGNLASVKQLLSRGANPFLKDKNGCNALHLAVLQDRKPIIYELLEVPNSSQLITEVNCKGDSPVHIGLKLGLGDFMLDLVSPVLVHCHSQCTYAKDSHGNNYLHLVAASGDWELLLEFLDLPNAQKLLNDTNECGLTPLHCAAMKGHSSCVEHLLNRGAMVHRCYKARTPLMMACIEGHVDCAKLLYKAHPFQIDWQDDLGDTALHYAARSGSPSMIQYILDLNGKILHNDSGQSFLDLITAGNDEDCGLAVVNHKRWQECLDMISPVREAPMLGLIKRMPAVAKAVLDRCYRKESSHSEVFNFKYLLCLDDTQLQAAENSLLSSGPSLLNRRKSTRKLDVGDFDMEAGHSIVKYRRSILQKSLVLKSKKKRVSQTMEVLQTMIQHKRLDLLIHPVVMEYLEIKWRSYGLLYYCFYYLFFILHIIFLTLFVVLGSSPSPSVNDSGWFNDTMGLDQNVSHNATSGPDYFQVNTVGEVLRWLAVWCNSIEMVVVITTFILGGRGSFNLVKYIRNWIIGISSMLSFIFLLHSNPFSMISLPFGACACFFSWLILFWCFEFFNVFGIYVTMFFKILRRVFHVLFISLFLLVAFALPMFLLGRSIREFSNLGFSLFSVFGYMLGEIQYSLFTEKSNSPNSYILIIFVAILAIMMSIVMANLLIGLAVGDIEQIKRNALYDRNLIEVEFFTNIDEHLPKFLHRKLVNLFVHSNNKDLSKFDHRKVMSGPSGMLRKWLRTMKILGQQALDPSNKTEGEGEASRTIDAPFDMASELTDIKKKLQDLSDIMHTTHGDHRCSRQPLRWQMPDSSSISLGSSHDFTDLFSDKMTDLNVS